MKKVLILSGSPRKGGNSDLLCDEFLRGIFGLFGITEPALYGVTLQHKKVMASVVISSFVGGLFIGLTKIKAFATVGPGIASMPMYIDPDNGKNFMYAVIAFVISAVLSFVLTLILYKDEVPAEGETTETAPAAVPAATATASAVVSSPPQVKDGETVKKVSF